MFTLGTRWKSWVKKRNNGRGVLRTSGWPVTKRCMNKAGMCLTTLMFQRGVMWELKYQDWTLWNLVVLYTQLRGYENAKLANNNKVQFGHFWGTVCFTPIPCMAEWRIRHSTLGNNLVFFVLLNKQYQVKNTQRNTSWGMTFGPYKNRRIILSSIKTDLHVHMV